MSTLKYPVRLLALALVLCAAAAVSAAPPYDSIALIRMTSPSNGSGGSGVYIGNVDNSAVILTCKHVAEKSGDSCIVQFGGTQYEGIVASVHKTVDCAIILTSIPKGVAPVAFSKLVPTKNTEPYVLAGFPGLDRSRLYYCIGRYQELTDQFLIVQCSPKPGMSGGACFNSNGELCGLVAAVDEKNNLGYCTAGKAFVEYVVGYLTGGPIQGE